MGRLNRAFSKAQKWAEMLCHPCILGEPQQRGQIQSGPKRWQKCYITLAFSGVSDEGGQNQNWLAQPCFFRGRKVNGNATSPLHSRGSRTKGRKSKRAQKRAEMLRHPCILGDPHQRGQNQSGPKRGRKCYITPSFSGLPNKGGQDQNWLAQPCLFKGTKVGGNAMSPLHSRGAPKKGTKSKWAQKRAEMLHHPFILGGPQQNGKNLSGPKRGQKCYITPAFSGVPNRGDKIKAGPKEGRNATSPLHSRGSRTKGTKSKRAQKRAEMLHHPCILGGPQQRGQNQSGPKRG